MTELYQEIVRYLIVLPYHIGADTDTVFCRDLFGTVYAHDLVCLLEHTAPCHVFYDRGPVFCGQHLDVHVEKEFVKARYLIVVVIVMYECHPYITLVVFAHKL